MAVSRSLVALCIVALSASSAPAGFAQGKSEGREEAPRGTPVLWRMPSDISSRDLFHGPGGEAGRPDLSRVTFVEEETGGFSTKYRVKDGAGRVWVAKIGKEAQSETAAVRLVWAVGYVTEINYLVPRLTIEGKGTFENVRLEARPENIKRLDEWKWSENPFAGTKELQGLVILMALLNNWDIKDSNNKVLHARDRGELHYIVSDLGATFGRVKSGAPVIWRIRRNRNDPEDYFKDPFLEDVKRGNVLLFYKGKRQDLFDDLRVEEARWIGGLLARLTDEQLGDAFRAANYTPDEIRLLTEAVRTRISELVNLSPGGSLGRKD
ncbi:MAG TPA: hypothetical protein VN228_04970 [Pyrinomonadaceae bacterium]|nr:hypothetical protein [Pyrinomonadaceae bacterium]